MPANDIEQATKLARNMVTRFGMSDEFGMMALGTVQNAYLNQDTSLTCAPGTAERVDAIVCQADRGCARPRSADSEGEQV